MWWLSIAHAADIGSCLVQTAGDAEAATFAEMLPLPGSGGIIDTPGMKQLSFNYLTPEDIRHNFREIFQVGKDCRFNDCSHRNEPGCAVIEAVETGEIYEGRYSNYLQLIKETESQNYWERQES